MPEAQQTILVTGGAGYIGSHACLALLTAGYRVVVVDDLSNGHREALARVDALAQQRRPGAPRIVFHHLAIGDRAGIDAIFAAHRFHAVMHFAGLKAVGESVREPLRYWRANVEGSLHLLEAMRAAGVRRLVFSSSATVYGLAERMPISEEAPLSTTNPYGATKLAIEELCRGVAGSEPGWHIVLLRYFNPVGADASGDLGEHPRGTPNNLVPYVLQVAVGQRPELSIFGGDWPTPDGTGVRDYIHVCDLIDGHLAALAKLDALPGATAINLGTGRGTSVLELVAAMSAEIGRPIPYRIIARRPGDVAVSLADPTRAADLLGWRARRDLRAMCADGWRFQQRHPQGYAD